MTARAGGTPDDPRRRRRRRLPSRDTTALSTAALLFSCGLGLASVTLPLLALERGRRASEIGLLVAMSAVVQIVARLRLGLLLRRVTDRHVFAFGALALGGSFGVALAGSSLTVLVLAWLVLGLGRACFWTAGQTHAVRGTGSPVPRLASMNLLGSTGALIGPVLAGVLAETDLRLALVAGVVVGAAAVVPALLLDGFPAFARDRPPQQARALWRRPGVDAACWSGVTAGAWRGLMDSYVPVALSAARHSSTTIGAVVSVGNAAAVAGAVVISRLPASATRLAYAAAMAVAAAGLAVFGFAATAAPAAFVALAVSGLGAGVLQTLGPAMAANAVTADEKGDVMSTYGALRNSAMFLTPLAASAALVVVPLSASLFAVGSLLLLPVLAARRLTPDGQGRARPPA